MAVMRRLRYAGEAFYVSDAVGAALLQYLRALTRVGEAGVVSLPALTDRGTPTEVQFVAGPSSQALLTSVDVAFEEPVSDTSVALLRRMTRRLGPERASTVSSTVGPADESASDFDFE
ncbi:MULTISPECIES: hypothetical protein [unclassified Plantibacter]|jgi:hypothetical protein|uniref:hypothetical protein n=1 Tax=unclassified Plantibacter TaxID=2624265 RepID=UPI003D337C47